MCLFGGLTLRKYTQVNVYTKLPTTKKLQHHKLNFVDEISGAHTHSIKHLWRLV